MKSLCFNVIIIAWLQQRFRGYCKLWEHQSVPRAQPVPQQLSELGQKSAGLFGCCLKIPLLMMRSFHNAPVIWIHLWQELKEILKQILQHYIKKYRGGAGGCDSISLFFPAGLKSLVSFRLPTWILLNQDRKLLKAREECSNHLGSVSCGLQYLAELLHCLRATAVSPLHCWDSRERLLCISLPWPPPLCSLGHQPFPPAEAFHSCLMIIFNQRDQSYFPQLSAWFVSGCWSLQLTEMMKITIQIMKFRHRKPD